MSAPSDIARRFVEPVALNVIAGFIVLIIAAVVGAIILFLRRSGRLKKVELFLSKIPKIRERVWTITWQDLQLGSQDLLKKIQAGNIDDELLFPDKKRRKGNKLRTELKKQFKPTVIFAPCCRGATIANAMFDNQDNRLPIYVGIRMTNPERSPNNKQIKKTYDKIHKSSTETNSCWIEAKTEKHIHFIPTQLIEMLKQNPNEKLLLLDDYASSGTSQKLIYQAIKNATNIDDNRIRRASLVVDRAAIDNLSVHFWWKLNKSKNYNFYFPWGKAV
ncbi:MAG: hypothetical protein FWD52_07040 [Candidatus Bathyarchaeota archaeon]|nr:hypothetical protein [Candidatus Termiticorpusculum sp.]